MRKRDRTYTMEELEAESGFDRRTVAYYVQEELLPRVGRRGPRTRYPRRFLDRLLFVRRVRELQDTGQLPPFTLAEIKEILDRIPPETVADVASGKEEVTSLVLGARGTGRLGAISNPMYVHPLARMLEQEAPRPGPLQGEQGTGTLSKETQAPDPEESVADLFEQAERAGEETPSRAGRWTTVSVTDDVLLTVRGEHPGILRLAERVARWLREKGTR